jgi:hypothetical protein
MVVKIIPKWQLMQNSCIVVLECVFPLLMRRQIQLTVWKLAIHKQNKEARLQRPSLKGIRESLWEYPLSHFNSFCYLLGLNSMAIFTDLST